MTYPAPTKPSLNQHGQRISNRATYNHQDLSDTALRIGERFVEPLSLQALWWRQLNENGTVRDPLPLHTNIFQQPAGNADLSELLNILDEVLMLTSDEEPAESLNGNEK